MHYNQKCLNIQESNTLCDDILNHEIVVGEKWYVISQKWWKEFLEAKDSVEQHGDKTFDDVKPISNAGITVKLKENKYTLKEKLIEQLDYQLIPEKVFNRLCEIFNVESKERDIIERKVVSGTLLSKNPFVEVYPLEIKIANFSKKNDVLTIEVSSGDSIDKIKSLALDALKISAEKRNSIRFYIDEDGKCEPISATITPGKLATLLQMNTIIYLMVDDEKLNDINGNNGNIRLYPSRSNSKNAPGLCGLQNLGNTCFMNSAIQCLSNVPELTKYFFEDKYKGEINSENPLGTGGRLARAYGDLIQQMWSGETSIARPSQLKLVIGQIAPRFNGYQQHDSQELLAFLLDGLHEDLNRIYKKPYIEEKESDGRPDELVSKEAWEDYKKRNDSVVVDTFHGQLKSTLICPKCQKISVKFDPFCFLSIPVPAKERLIKSAVFVVRKEATKHAKCVLTHSLKTTVKQAIDEICNKVQNLSSRIVMIAVNHSFGSNYSFEKFLDPDQQLQYSYYSSQKNFIAYPVKDGPLLVVENATSNYESPISIPLILNYDPENLTRDFVESKIVPYVQDLLGKKKKTGIESSDDETEKAQIMPVSYAVSIKTEVLKFSSNPLEPIIIKNHVDGEVKLILKWSDGKIFDPKIDDVVEREISVGILNKSQYTLDECIATFTTQEKLGDNDSWYCPTCKDHVRAYKKLDLWKLPHILIIHLKRFSYTRWSRDKIETPIVIPVKDFDLKGKLVNKEHEHAIYDLIGISNHMGSLGGGHYTATCLNNGRWVDFNDNSVSVENGMPDTLTSREAYMLVYRKAESMPVKRRSHLKNEESSLPTRYALRSVKENENMEIDDE